MRSNFAEFLNNSYLARLGLLDLTTCVRSRYGPDMRHRAAFPGTLPAPFVLPSRVSSRPSRRVCGLLTRGIGKGALHPTAGMRLPDPSLLGQDMSGLGILDPMCIGCAFRPLLSPRLTQGGRTLPWRPQSFGGGDSHPSSLLTPAFSLACSPGVLSVSLRPACDAPLPNILTYKSATSARRLAPVNFRRRDA